MNGKPVVFRCESPDKQRPVGLLLAWGRKLAGLDQHTVRSWSWLTRNGQRRASTSTGEGWGGPA